MKTLFAIVALLISFSVNAQRLQVKNGEIQITASSKESVNDAFVLIKKLAPVNMKWYDRYVVKDGKTYYRSPLNKRKTYLVDGFKLRRL